MQNGEYGGKENKESNSVIIFQNLQNKIVVG